MVLSTQLTFPFLGMANFLSLRFKLKLTSPERPPWPCKVKFKSLHALITPTHTAQPRTWHLIGLSNYFLKGWQVQPWVPSPVSSFLPPSIPPGIQHSPHIFTVSQTCPHKDHIVGFLSPPKLAAKLDKDYFAICPSPSVSGLKASHCRGTVGRMENHQQGEVAESRAQCSSRRRGRALQLAPDCLSWQDPTGYLGQP